MKKKAFTLSLTQAGDIPNFQSAKVIGVDKNSQIIFVIPTTSLIDTILARILQTYFVRRRLALFGHKGCGLWNVENKTRSP
jgi:hypothetical protein